jgi:hypothetical protein
MGLQQGGNSEGDGRGVFDVTKTDYACSIVYNGGTNTNLQQGEGLAAKGVRGLCGVTVTAYAHSEAV